jgi:hypothetical protein
MWPALTTTELARKFANSSTKLAAKEHLLRLLAECRSRFASPFRFRADYGPSGELRVNIFGLADCSAAPRTCIRSTAPTGSGVVHAEGQPSQSFMTAIGERERELQAITNKLIEPGPGSLRATLDELRTFAVSRLTRIRELISHPECVDLARAVLAEYFGTFTLEPTIQDGEPVYLAHGKDFFGDEAMARTGGAGGQNWTERLPVHFNWQAAA